MTFEHTARLIADAGPLPDPSGMPSFGDDWPLPDVEVEQAESAGLVVRPESPAVAS